MQKVIRKIAQKLLSKLNDFSLHKKLLYLFVGCVLIPLVITDSVILGILWREETQKNRTEMKNIADSVLYDLKNSVDSVTILVNQIYISPYMNNFLETNYNSSNIFFDSYYQLRKKMVIGFNSKNSKITFYTNNKSIISSGNFYAIGAFKEEEWMKKIRSTNRSAQLFFYYSNNKSLFATPKRQISYIRKLNYFNNSEYEKYLKCDIDYNSIVRNLTYRKYSMPVYVCSGDQILLSNDGLSYYTQPFDTLDSSIRPAYRLETTISGLPIQILVMRPKDSFVLKLVEEIPLILFMISINTILPILLMYLINNSFTNRLSLLSNVFKESIADDLQLIQNIDGKDEIASLMKNYNRMATKSNELIKTVYKDKMERQEIDIAKQNAELLALQSQINPHFLFNVLESIRMHSVLKSENETADMIEKLSVLVRKNVDWQGDFTTILEETRFIENYLLLQKYRFGDRLDFEITIHPDCEQYYLPKLSLVTFVENSCVHGLGNKAGVCKIFVRAYQTEDELILEVEDTGCGIEEEYVDDLNKRMNDCCLEDIKESNHIGILNASLRLKMVTNKEAKFVLESEVGVGTSMIITIPSHMLSKEEVI